MTHFGVLLASLALVGAASAGLWTREFDPDLVTRPAEEYEAEYQRHLATRQETVCTAEDIKACNKNPGAGWELVEEEGKILDCSPIGKQETKAQFWIPDPAKPCCKYHGCVVADCAALTKEFRYSDNPKCTKNDEETGVEDKCKHRIKKKTCGCEVHECEVKGCEANVKCTACLVLTNQTDICGCQTEEISCKPELPPPGKATCDEKTKCDKCEKCDKTSKIFGEECANKYKEHDKHFCSALPCPADEKCNSCQTPKFVDDDGCCKRIVCEDIPAPECVKPDQKTGKCANECEEPVNVPFAKGCGKTAKCCQTKKCEAKPAEECGECHSPTVGKDVCGCAEQVCKLDPIVDMCQTPVDYKVVVKTGGANTPALSAFTKLTAKEKASVPKTAGAVKVTITGTCTKAEETLPEVPKKKCVVEFPAGSLNDPNKRVVEVKKKCGNLGHIEKVEVEQDTVDIWFVEEVDIISPKDPKNPKEEVSKKVPVNKFVATVDPNHQNWGKAGPWEPTAEVVVRKPFKCDACEELKKLENITCPAHEEGHCVPKACPEPKPCEDECAVVVPSKDSCACATKICVETLDPTHVCPPGSHLILVASAKCQKKHTCIPDNKCSTEAPIPECTQCQELVLAQTPVVLDAEKEEVTFCENWVCKEREQCMTKEEAQEKLQCHLPCEEAVETGEKMECGCKKWECAPKNTETCSENCGPCGVCKEVYSTQCERPMFECVKECKPQEDCQVPKLVNGEQAMDECECPAFQSKPCITDPVHACEKGVNTIAEGQDRCGCDSKILVPCKQTEKPVCNETCHDLVEETDGCCNTYTCQKKPCPEVEKPECAKCEQVVVHEDSCQCCKSTCERIPCPPLKRCPLGLKPVLLIGECSCPVLVKCTPGGGSITSCPKEKKCKNPDKAVELCDECEP